MAELVAPKVALEGDFVLQTRNQLFRYVEVLVIKGGHALQTCSSKSSFEALEGLLSHMKL